MKKSLLMLAFLGGVCIAYAQPHVQFGMKGGLNLSTIAGENFNFNVRPSFHTGGLAHIHLNDRWAIQPELVFSDQGAKYDFNGVDRKVRLGYINVPSLIQYMTKSGFRFETGPQVGFLAIARTKISDDENVNVNDNFKPVDLSWAFGVGYLFPSGFGLDARYNVGITKINDNDGANQRNAVFQTGVFYQFPPIKHKH